MTKHGFLTKKKIFTGLMAIVGAVVVVLLTLSGDHEIRHVVLISMDTCRADHLSCYGFERETTPAIDAFAEDAVVFEHCISPVALTLPSHSSMLTGVTPLTHGVHDNSDYQLSSSNTTLAEILKKSGYSTGAIVSSFVLDRQFGLDQGFDDYNDTFEDPMSSFHGKERRGDETTKVANAWLEKHANEKSFLFIHYYDPHQSYRPPEPYATDFSDDLYAGEIAYTDHCISQVIGKLKDLGVYDNTLLIITGDHGEGRGDHEERQHGYYIYQSCTHVPLMIRSPGKQSNVRIRETVGLIDLVPTICGQLGIQPPTVCQGIDLGGYLENKPVENDRYLYSESLLPTRFGCSPLMSLVKDRWKYIQAPRAEMYNLDEDPDELHNLIEVEGQRARLFKENLKLMVQEQVQVKEADSSLDLDAASRQKLESLGYVASHTVEEDFDFDETKDDPKDWFLVNQKVMLVTSFIKVEQYNEAERVCLEIIAEKPEYILSYYYLADVQHKLKKYDLAIAHANDFLFRVDEKLAGRSKDHTPVPDNARYRAETYNIIGMCYAETQRYPKALDAYQAAIEIASQALSSQVHYNIGNVYLVRQDFEQAKQYYLKAIELNPDLAEAYLNIGLVCLYQDKFDSARQYFEKALDLKPRWGLALRNLAAVEKKEQLLKAIAECEELLGDNPNQPAVLERLASSYYLLGNKEKAVKAWSEALSLAPDSSETLNNLAFMLSEDPEQPSFDLDRALDYAKQACELSDYQNVSFLDTLAKIYAIRGDFSNAAETCEQAIDLAAAGALQEMVQVLETKLQAYRSDRMP